MNKKADNQQLIKDYYAAYEKKDWSILQRILADDFTFTSPAGDDRINIKTYKEKCWPNAENTKKFELEAIFADDTSGLATYNGYTNAGKLFRNTELFRFKDGKILSNECFFGTGVNFPNNEGK
jgi:ketosteroid isomerase-like protein